ncbi:hypothetical protein BJ508DRAFT_126249 [Ascobolus immersus RN42]|uniref:Uncharacterized protein n=1 Tax=Ascobolus immersus RN42 TaxID=1160509 RepID=A0A3N4I564_ASCIM|nr:hypothetical protein BJ508DRAFT_126249 [Ascobolus immersus RN42]
MRRKAVCRQFASSIFLVILGDFLSRLVSFLRFARFSLSSLSFLFVGFATGVFIVLRPSVFCLKHANWVFLFFSCCLLGLLDCCMGYMVSAFLSATIPKCLWVRTPLIIYSLCFLSCRNLSLLMFSA